jgi:hypothetical protein
MKGRRCSFGHAFSGRDALLRVPWKGQQYSTADKLTPRTRLAIGDDHPATGRPGGGPEQMSRTSRTQSGTPRSASLPTLNGYSSGYVFSVGPTLVAQTCSLLCRRIVSCTHPPVRARLAFADALPIANRRYGSLKICATLNGYSSGEPYPVSARCADLQSATGCHDQT